MKKLVNFCLFCSIFLSFSCVSCCSGKNNEAKLHPDTDESLSVSEVLEEKTTLTLTFAGDLMAHDVNFNMSDYREIYTDLAEILLQDDLSFCNVEMPVCETMPLSSYPNFNVHRSYIQAAIDGGFDVFAQANNHTNDQGIKGIAGTVANFEALEATNALKEKKIYYSGLKKNATDEIKPTVIEKNGFTILFLSITEILNSYGNSQNYLYYSAPTEEGRKLLLQQISKMREKTPCDLFILSLHLNEAEYGLNVSNQKKLMFQRLADAGVDIICASHPHVMQYWEKHESNNSTLTEAQMNDENHSLHSHFFMYSMGNFISGQRMALNYANPKHYREYTGDAILLQLTFKKLNGNVLDDYSITPIPVTVYESAKGLVIKRFNQQFIDSLSNEKDKRYYQTRLQLMKDYLPLE
jgi:hypothetical protein